MNFRHGENSFIFIFFLCVLSVSLHFFGVRLLGKKIPARGILHFGSKLVTNTSLTHAVLPSPPRARHPHRRILVTPTRHCRQAKIEREQRYGAPPPPPPRWASPPSPPPSHHHQPHRGEIDVRKSVAGSRGSYKIKEGDCLYRIAVNNGVDPVVLEAMNPELAARPYFLQPGEYVRIP